jgi:hypothetical protein
MASGSFVRRQLHRLAGLKFQPTSVESHVEVLADVSSELVEAAVTLAQRECVDFPPPAVLLGLVERVRLSLPLPAVPDRSAPLETPHVVTIPQAGLSVPVTREWRYYCDECRDGGWESVQCAGKAPQDHDARPACQRDGAHAAHEFVTPCRCRTTNPAYARKREAQTRMAAQRAKANERGAA